MDMMLFLLLPTSFAFVYGVNLENLVLVIGWYLISGPPVYGLTFCRFSLRTALMASAREHSAAFK